MSHHLLNQQLQLSFHPATVHHAATCGRVVCRAMGDIKDLSSTAIYAWTTLISVLICVPGALIFEGPRLQAGIDAALKKEPNFYLALLSVGLLYHLYNQVSHRHLFNCFALTPCWWVCLWLTLWHRFVPILVPVEKIPLLFLDDAAD